MKEIGYRVRGRRRALRDLLYQHGDLALKLLGMERRAVMRWRIG